MSYTLIAVYCQPQVSAGGGGGGGECDPYTRPLPTSVATNLTVTPIIQSATAVATNLCAEVT